MSDRSVTIQIDRGLVMRCAELATNDGISTVAWIERELARALASVDTHPKDGDAQQAPLVSGAVGEAETPNPIPTSPPRDGTPKRALDK